MTVDYSISDFADDAAELDLDFSVENTTDGAIGASVPPALD